MKPTTPTQRGFSRTVAEIDRTIDGLIEVAKADPAGLDLLKQLRDWSQETERRLETVILEGER